MNGERMPRGDGTGPNSLGQLSGRRMGYCAGYNAPGFTNDCFGYGRGPDCGRRFGRNNGFRRRFFYNQTQQIIQPKEFSEKELLEELKKEKQELEKAIRNIEEKTKKQSK